MAMASRYEELGVDVRKKGIEAFKSLLTNIFPDAFCVVSEDPDLPGYGTVLHTDGAGSKPIISYLAWKETGDLRFFHSLSQDVLAMNVDDILCVGAKPLGFVDYVALNPFKVPKVELLQELSRGFENSLSLLKSFGVPIAFLGGETADLPDQIETLDVSGTILGRVRLDEAITGKGIQAGDLIVGLASDGKARYEERTNSGLMCNGITLARKSLLKPDYGRLYPEIVASEGKPYMGRFSLDDPIQGFEDDMTILEALSSPTRLFAPVVVRILEKAKSWVKGLIHNTGGGQTKCLRLGKGIHYVKDRILPINPLFRLIQKESGEGWRDMFQDFNMGIGFEVIVDPEGVEEVLRAAEDFGIAADIVGKCHESHDKNRLTIKSPFGTFHYEA
jgi:phosphoribosylformylglycinamidine cyclo-ligase